MLGKKAFLSKLPYKKTGIAGIFGFQLCYFCQKHFSWEDIAVFKKIHQKNTAFLNRGAERRFFIAKKRGKQMQKALHEGIHNCVMVSVENYMKCDMDNLYIFCV